MKAARRKLATLICLGILHALALSAFGQTTTSIDLARESVDFTVISRDGGDRLGSANTLALGDFNGDGILDLLLGAGNGDGPDDRRRDAGEAYVIYGRADLPPTFDVDGVPGPDVIIWGRDPGDRLGAGVAAGDVNGDGIDDIILGAPGGDGPTNSLDSVGEVVVIFGRAGLPAKIDLMSYPADLIIFNNRQRSDFGSAIISLDINGDGLDDIVMADSNASNGAGAAYGVYGRVDLPKRIDVANPMGPDLFIFGQDRGDRLGSILASGDINGDGIEDLVIGAPFADGPNNTRTDAGEAYVIYGSTNLPRRIDLAATSADLTVYGADAGDQLGTSVATGNINSDGFSDLLVGAPGASGTGNTRGGAGEAYIIFGKTALASVFDIRNNTQDVTVIGAKALENLGSAVAAGDLDGDRLQELIIGARGGRGPQGDRPGAGHIYVMRNTNQFTGVIDLSTNPANLVIYGARAGDALGSALAGADITGRGVGILLMGAPGADSPGNGPDAGVVYALEAAEFIRPNNPPIADAGRDRRVLIGTVVQLDGSGSRDPDGDTLSFSWEILSRPQGSAAALSDPASATPNFTADLEGEYRVQLTVEDGRGGSASAQVTITASREEPPPPPDNKGDVDGDGRITIIDARLICEYVLGLRTLTPEQLERADVAPPFGEITMDDAQFIAEVVVGLRTIEGGSSAGTAGTAKVTPLHVRSWKVLASGRGFDFRALGAGIEAVRVEVFRLSGQVVFRSPWTVGDRLFWRPDGEPLANGVYLYVITARGAQGEVRHSALGKIVLLR
jgi:hypothetical protein